jgi:hypothetical protein
MNEMMPTSLPCFDHSRCTLRRWHQGYSRGKVDPMTESPTEFVGLAQQMSLQPRHLEMEVRIEKNHITKVQPTL